MNIIINVKFLGGSSIETCIQEAKDLCRKLNVAYIEFSFNSRKLSISQDADIKKCVELFEDGEYTIIR